MITTKITLISSIIRRIAGEPFRQCRILRRPPSGIWRLASFSRSGVRCLSSVVCLLAVSALAGDLAVDNLTVSSNAAIHGKIDVISTTDIVITNEGVANGGAITTNGGYIIHTFTNVGTVNFTLTSCPLQGSVFVVAGGGAGGAGSGAGGAGGLIYIPNYTMPTGTYTVTVGAGGSVVGQLGTNGSNSVFGNLTAIGGGRGGQRWPSEELHGKAGGSGGGARWNGTGGATIQPGTNDGYPNTGFGYNGGNGSSQSGAHGGGGGGGAGGAGANGTTIVGGDGGIGRAYDISGTLTYYAGGGGGGCNEGSSFSPGVGGLGGGGNGGKAPTNGTSAIANTGGGGGGCSDIYIPGAGGSGIVIVRYAATTTSNITALTISSNGIYQASASGVNVLMGKLGVGTDNPAEKLHVVGNARVDGTNIVSAIILGGQPRTNWPDVAVGALSASSNLLDVANKAIARANLGLGTAATNDASAFDPAGAAGAFSNTLSAHTANLNNPHQVTASQVGALTSTGNGSQLTGITVAQVAGALTASNNLSDVADVATARDNLGALSTSGGIVNGGVDFNGLVSFASSFGNVPMGVFTNR